MKVQRCFLFYRGNSILMRVFIALSFATIFFQCKKEYADPQIVNFQNLNCPASTRNVDTASIMIVGTYDWEYTNVYTRIGLTSVLTPQTEGKYKRYVFHSTGVVHYYENLSLQWSKRYTVDYEFRYSQYPEDSSATIFFFDSPSGDYSSFFNIRLCNQRAILWKPASIEHISYFTRH